MSIECEHSVDSNNNTKLDVLRIEKKTSEWIAKTFAQTHTCGLSVVAPNGAGKSTFAETNPEWVDGDKLVCSVAGLGKKTSMTESDMKLCDEVTNIAKKLGLWVLTSTWWDPKLVDVFVIPPKNVLRTRVAQKDFHRDFFDKDITPYIANIILPLAKKHNIPIVTDFKDVLKVVNLPKVHDIEDESPMSYL